MSLYCDAGYEMFENDAGEAVHFAQNVYNAEAWKISPFAVITDVMPNVWCRAPGSTQVHFRTFSSCAFSHFLSTNNF